MRVVRPSLPRSAALACLSAATVAALAGCGTDDLSFGQTGGTGAATATVTAPAEVPPSTTPLPSTTTVTAVVPATGGGTGGSGSSGSGSGDSGCAPDIGTSAAAARDSARIAQPPHGSWHAYNAGGSWCRGLSWIELDQAGALAPVRDRQLLIYHNGYLQGTGIRCDAEQGQYVLSTTPDAIAVQYTYIDESNPAQQHSQGGVGRADVTFRWNGSRVVMDGSLPYAFTQGKC